MTAISMSREQLRQLQLIELIILLEIDRICTKYHIHYVLSSGTLLGAVRHRGFIPWDDDIDITMLRCEYDRFRRVCRTELSAPFYLLDTSTDKNYVFPFVKICLNDTIALGKDQAEVAFHKGIWIDIFPADNAPYGKITTFFFKYLRKYLRCGIEILHNYYPEKNILVTLLYFLATVPLRAFNDNTLVSFRDRVFQKYNKKPSKQVVVAGFHYDRNLVDRSSFEDIIYLPFEDILFPVPRDYHTVLTVMYGDYRVLPPEEERYKGHNLCKIDFGPYNNIDEINTILNNYRRASS